jgi:hypothetical protein
VVSKRLSDQPTVVYTCQEIPATIDEKINKETPFEIPFSVINSHKYNKLVAPTVSVKAVNKIVVMSVEITCPHNK